MIKVFLKTNFLFLLFHVFLISIFIYILLVEVIWLNLLLQAKKPTAKNKKETEKTNNEKPSSTKRGKGSNKKKNCL